MLAFFKRSTVRLGLLVVVTLSVVIFFISNLRIVADGPADFQANLYRQYFPMASQRAWEDFCSQPRGIADEKLEKEIVISLTSYPPRMQTTWLAIESLLRQDIKPSKVVLNLSLEEFPDKKLPSPIEEQIKRGLEINWCPGNLKSYKKLIPAIQKYPEAMVVAVDDDIIYPANLLKDLLIGHTKYPNCMIVRDVREIIVKEKKVLPVSQWRFSNDPWVVEEIPPSYNLVGQGIGGLLIPPHIFHEDALKRDLFMTLAPTDDDMWWYAMTVINGGKVAKIFNNQRNKYIDGTQNTALWRIHLSNHKQVLSEIFQRVFRHYNLGRILNAQDALTDESAEIKSTATISDKIVAVRERVIDFFKRTLIK
jgi:hypothetical protein